MLDLDEPTEGWRAAAAFIFMFALLPVVAGGGGHAAAALAGIVGLASAPWTQPRRLLGAWPALAAMTGLIAWLAATQAWSLDERGSQWPKTTAGLVAGVLLLAGAMFVGGKARRLTRWVAVGAIGLLIVLLGIEATFDMPINRYFQPDAATTTLERNPGKGVSMLVLFLWGAMATLVGGSERERLLWRLLFLATAALSLQFAMAANAVAFGAGLAAFMFGWMAPRAAPIILTGAVALYLALAPLLIPPLLALLPAGRLPDSWQMRVQIWEHALSLVREKPIAGWGLGAARELNKPIGDLNGQAFGILPLHPHSWSLHVWIETGAIGACLLAATVALGGVAIARAFEHLGRPAIAGLCGVIGAAAAIWNISYGAWQEWWIGAIFIALATALLAREKSRSSQS